MFSLRWRGTNHTSRAQSPLLEALSFLLKLPDRINLSVGNSSEIISRPHQQGHRLPLPPEALPPLYESVPWAASVGKGPSSPAQVNPFQLNLNNQSVRELRIQAGQKAKVLLLSLLQHHLSRDVSAIHGGAKYPPTNNTPPPSPPILSSRSVQPNIGTAGLSHQLYGGELPWCQLKELIRTAVCLCEYEGGREREGEKKKSQREIERGWEVTVKERKCWCALTQIHIYL